MGSFVNSIETGILDKITGATGGTVYVPEASNLWLALWVGDPGESGAGGAECSYTGYARKQIDFNTAVAASRKVVQNGLLTFPESSSTLNGVSHYMLFDTESGTEEIAYGVLNSTRNIVSGNSPTVASGEVEISINTGAWSDYLVEAILNWVFNQGSFSTPAHYAAFATAALGDTSTGTTLVDLTMTGYARKLITAGDFDAAISGDPSYTANGSLIDFGQFTAGGPETAEALAICDAITDGNLLLYDNSQSQQIDDDDTVQIPSGSLDVTFA